MKETLIKKSYNDNLNVKDDYYGADDWSKNLDYDEWVK